MDKIVVNFRTAAVNVKRLDAIAKLEDRDRSYVLNRALETYLDRMDWQVDEVRKAMKECDAGDCLTHEQFQAEVRAWDE